MEIFHSVTQINSQPILFHPRFSDLTLIPPPKTPEDEKLIDFCSPDDASPPPDFNDPSKAAARGEAQGGEVRGDGAAAAMAMMSPDMLPPHILEKLDTMVQNDEDLGTQLAAIAAVLPVSHKDQTTARTREAVQDHFNVVFRHDPAEGQGVSGGKAG